MFYYLFPTIFLSFHLISFYIFLFPPFSLIWSASDLSSDPDWLLLHPSSSSLASELMYFCSIHSLYLFDCSQFLYSFTADIHLFFKPLLLRLRLSSTIHHSAPTLTTVSIPRLWWFGRSRSTRFSAVFPLDHSSLFLSFSLSSFSLLFLKHFNFPVSMFCSLMLMG